MSFSQGSSLDSETVKEYWRKVPPYPECVVCRRVILKISEATQVEVEDPPTDQLYIGNLSTVNYDGHLICWICNKQAQRRNIQELSVPCKLEDLKNKCRIKVRKVKK